MPSPRKTKALPRDKVTKGAIFFLSLLKKPVDNGKTQATFNFIEPSFAPLG
jgi:hypothetical protein